MTKYIVAAVCTFLFIEAPLTHVVAESRELYVPSSTATGYPGTCYYEAVYGSTVEEVGNKYVEMNNSVTTMECSQRCRNPASFVAAYEKIFILPLDHYVRELYTLFLFI